MAKIRKVRFWSWVGEQTIEKTIQLCGFTTIIIVLGIFVFLLRDALPILKDYSLSSLLGGKDWYPTEDPPALGMLPLILGTVMVTLGSVVIGIPLGVAAAIYIGEIASARVREILKPTVEVLAAIPSVVIGFLGMVLLAPWMQQVLNLPTGLAALTGSVMLAFMAMPTIISISEDALRAVPRDYAAAAAALGATKWQTISKVLVPAARSGILAACMLGVGRAIGETMTLLMVTGNAAVMPQGLGAMLNSVRTLTATIAAEMGETEHYGQHYHALFFIGALLFLITFAINLIADLALHRSAKGQSR